MVNRKAFIDLNLLNCKATTLKILLKVALRVVQNLDSKLDLYGLLVCRSLSLLPFIDPEMNHLMRYKWWSHSIWTFYLELNSNFFNFKVIVVNIYIDLEFTGINYWFNQMQLLIPALFSAWCIWYAGYFIDNMMEHRCKNGIFILQNLLWKVTWRRCCCCFVWCLLLK